MITIVGPTASGKTNLAAHLALKLNGEVISADSRQVYRQLNIGSGKDLNEFVIDGMRIPYHLIDICDVGEEYNVFRFQEDFHIAYQKTISRDKQTILCGGTGLYLQAVLDNYKLYPVPKNDDFRAELESKKHGELIELLKSITSVHNTTDINSKARTIKAIEIAKYCKENNIEKELFPKLDAIVFGINPERKVIKERITNRLKSRLENGMVEEVEHLLKTGITPEQLKFLGLEYKFLTQYMTKELSYNDMFQKLNSAIQQFAKRQMTWFRRMEKQGHQIHWIDEKLSLEEKMDFVFSKL